MKKMILCIIITTVWSFVQGQNINQKIVTGSWINTNVTDYYESNSDHSCDIKDFDSDRFLPLYLSFVNASQLKITFRIEQKVFTYKINNFNSDSISIFRGKNIYKIYLIKNLLKLRYNENLITFKKVSDNYSNDIFGEFVKNMIFKKHKSYTVASIKKMNNYDSMLNRNNFEQKMKEVFNCKQVEIVRLGSLKFKKFCLPEIALYNNSKNKWDKPKVLGVLIDKDNIKFIDNSGDIILTINPN